MFHQVLNDIAYHKIQIFQAPAYENEDEETQAEQEEIAVSPRLCGNHHYFELNSFRRARSHSPSLDQINWCRLPMDVKSVDGLTRGVSLRSTMKIIAISLNSAKCSSGRIWKNCANIQTLTCTKRTDPRSSLAWELHKIRASLRKSSVYYRLLISVG